MYLTRVIGRILSNNSIKVNNFNVQTSLFSRSVSKMTKEFDKEELKKRLTPIQYHVTQEKGTERPYTGCYNKFKEVGTYLCVVCDEELFTSDTKFDSGCGWPAFKDVINQGKVKLTTDTSAVGANLLLLINPRPGMIRTEVTCAACGAHLGHVFDDGPPPKKTRYCINSASMTFIPKDQDINGKQAGDS